MPECCYIDHSNFFVHIRVIVEFYCRFLSSILCCHSITNVKSCKYLGYWLSTDDDDIIDIENHIRLLYARTNFLIWWFCKCSTAVEKCIFRAYFINFFGGAIWKRYSVSVMRKFQAAYNKCIQLFFVMRGGIALQQCSWNWSCQPWLLYCIIPIRNSWDRLQAMIIIVHDPLYYLSLIYTAFACLYRYGQCAWFKR